MKQKTNRLHFSTRTIAMVLSIVMLIGSIATGSMLSTFAAYLKDAAANSDAVSQAASEGSDIAKSAIPSQDSDAAITDNNDTKDAPDLSGFEENEIVRGMKQELADTGANINLANTGYSGCRVKGSWDGWTLHDISSSSYTETLAADTEYTFVYLAGDNNDQFATSTTISGSVSNYNIPRDYTGVAIKLKTTIAGSYVFSFKGYDGGQTAMSVNIAFPEDTTPDTWTAVGAYGTGTNPDAGFFGTAWAPTATANDLTKSGTTWSKTWNNVTLSNAETIYYKVAKNHAWDIAYPAANATQALSAGTYNITITYNESNNAVNLTYTTVAKSTLSVASVEHATVKATYNGTTAQEGGTISNIPQGATVNVSVTPDTGFQCTGITSTGGGTTSGSMYSFTLTMPGNATTVSADITTVTLKKIYFNNSYTLYGSVYAYVYDKSGTTETYQYLGKYPGTTMNKLDNSNIWYIDVPSDVDYVKFVSGEGYTTGEMKIPWQGSGESETYAYPKYTAPYGHNAAPTKANGGTWGDYIYGSNNKRTNEYTVSDGTTMSASNLFTGITATMYDYYTDGEITASAGTASDTGASGAPNGWIKGIGGTEYTWTSNGWEWNPYRKLNSALSAYSSTSSVTYPLYFGNLNVTSKDSNNNSKYAINTVGGAGGEMDRRTEIVSYTNWNQDVNGSIALDNEHNAVTGLSGKTLANDTIHYYADGATNENGVPMAMFDEDFLSGENNQNKALATILRTSSFPVRQEQITGYTKIYIDYTSMASWAIGGGTDIYAHFWDASGNTADVKGVSVSGKTNVLSFDIPGSGYTNLCFYRANSPGNDWWNKSDDLTYSNNVLFITSNDSDKITGSWQACDYAINADHTYYEYDSTGGKDNAYIESINKTDKTAVINYYNNTNKVHSNSNTDGFFPFNRNAYVPNQNELSYAQDLGFGMKLTIPFNLEGSDTANGINTDGTDQTFDFSGDDDLWVFVDGKLVLDLGGAHARTTGSINFHTKTITANNKQAIASGVDRNGSFADGFNTNENYVHTMTIYYMERGMYDSNLKFGFSFHAIPNQFWIDKKIRTKDIINAGFYTSNGQSGSASNQDDILTQREGRFISKFEASYQDESFTVEHKYGSTAAGATSPASGMKYTIDNDTNTYTTPLEGTYPIKHDLGNAFIGQFTTGQYFNLKETFGNNNKYVYTPVFSVWDQANNNKALSYPSGSSYGDNTSGYTFRFNPTTTVQTAIENTNIKARFENYMVAHTLTLKKEITNATDTTTSFTIQVLFDFEGNGNYIAYPLHCDVDGVRTKLSNTGTIDITAGQILEIEEIPQNAKIQVVEVLPASVEAYRYNGYTLKNGTTDVTSNSTAVAKGAKFVMGDNDMTMTFSNKKPDNRYTIKYNYTSYDNLYGQQSYTVSGVFTENELKTYLTLDGSGNLAFKTESLKKGFINRKAPLEDNFMQTLSFADSNIDETNGGGWVNGNYSCQVTAAATTEDKISVSFKLPYAVDSKLVAQESDGKVSKITAQSVGAKEVTCFDWYVTDGASKKTANWEPNNTTFVKAPLIIYNGNTPYYFQYWSVKKASSYGMKAAEYTRCYDYEFNLSLFMDTVIEPVYDTTWVQTDNPPTTYNMYNRFDPEKQIAADNTNGISIAFLENSRNQYNNGDRGTRLTDATPAADVIYSDFLLSFNNFAGKEQLNTRTEGTTKAGLVIEAVGYLNGSNASGFDTTTEYRNETNIGTEGTMKTAIKSWVEGSSTKPNGCAKSEFDVRALDNKNRIQYYYALNNRKLDTTTGNLLDTMQNRYKVFRAYAYIGNVKSGGGLQDVVVSDPVYFTIYDMASNGLSNNATVN